MTLKGSKDTVATMADRVCLKRTEFRIAKRMLENAYLDRSTTLLLTTVFITTVMEIFNDLIFTMTSRIDEPG